MSANAQRKGGRGLKIAVSIVISAFFIWLTLRNTDLSRVLEALKNANYLYLLPYFAVTVAIHFARTVRWGILLEPLGKPGFKRLNSASAIGFMALVILPFRLGEFARPLLIAEKGRIRRSAAMASVVVERVVDGLAMAAVLVVALLFSNPVTRDAKTIAWVRAGGVAIFAVFGGLLVFLVAAYLKRDLAVRLVNRLATPISAKLAKKASGMLDSFIGALKMVPDGRKIALFLLLTAFYWGINGAGMAILGKAFGFDLPLAAAYAVLGVLVVGVMIPAGPGMLGTFQGAVVLGMQLFFPGDAFEGQVQAFAWVLWAMQFGQQVGFGLAYLVAGHISFESLMSAGDAEEEPELPATGTAAAEDEAERLRAAGR